MQHASGESQSRPLVELGNVRLNGNQLDLARHVKEGCKQEGLVGLTFSTIGVRWVGVSFV